MSYQDLGDYASDRRIQCVHRLNTGAIFQVDLVSGSHIQQVMTNPEVWTYQGFNGVETVTDERRWDSLADALKAVLGGAR